MRNIKKKIYLLFVFVLSLFVFSGRVDAEELYCIYDDGWTTTGKLIVQDSSGNISLYMTSSGEVTIDNVTWKIKDEYSLDFSASKYFSSEKKLLTDCPEYSSAVSRGKIKFYDEKTWGRDYELLDSGKRLPDYFFSNLYMEFFSDTDYSDEINNTTWIGNCDYGNIKIYFNNEKLIFLNSLENRDTSRLYFTLNELLDFVNDTGTCPLKIYECYGYTIASMGMTLYLPGEYYLTSQGDSTLVIPAGDGVTNYIEYNEFPLVDGDVPPLSPEDPIVPIEDCEDLFGDELVKKINEIMNTIKIVVPILLIGFGILDFTKAIFSGNSDEMNKSQKKFIKRLLAAILIFFVPIFINFILSLANEVWSNINPDTCIK